MRVLFRFATLALIAVSLMGCSHFHSHPSQQAQAPPLQTGQGELAKEAKKNQQPPPDSTLPQPTAQVTPPPLPPAKQPKVKRSKRPKTSEKNPSTAPAATQQAANSAPDQSEAQAASVSPIGQLTTGDSATQAKAKQDALTLISTTEQGLGNIKRSLSSDEQATLLRIRTFLKQSKQALDTGDSDGALTLATKAKLLLDELVNK
jgi:outer membrane biosynthesis protein TonB